mmetsp:Transcript_21612/g.45464  ORF Transcript_21612/g.45464 Transcript_21612/m.45464 type:complete len:280 (-) Transcript_21612:156-995(-)|eukprot:CAMPEP_0171332934 /NCGR_PEP_ID=MMETSP0878-20121228/3697_1 /TAXON_ID=67004 /ORGANISM="Thalassiosira weissflogii, Strain CCMP1336" /LENGTH=279 /DNA_ID=CAMNT_0011833787 /DNA_START=53 /DNA_END=892 /DNA_ORIENTATION=+
MDLHVKNPTSVGISHYAVVCHDYHDHSKQTLRDHLFSKLVGNDVPQRDKKPNGGIAVPFPTKLHLILSQAEESGFDDIISWQPHGRCFLVHDHEKFVDTIMPSYFNQTRYTSFQRQLNLYGFRRLTAGRDRNAYYHEYFLKHKLFLCENIVRFSIKGNGVKPKPNPDAEPNFYNMPFLEPESNSDPRVHAPVPKHIAIEQQKHDDQDIDISNTIAGNQAREFDKINSIIQAHENDFSSVMSNMFYAMSYLGFVPCCENPVLEWEALEKLEFDSEFSFLA